MTCSIFVITVGGKSRWALYVFEFMPFHGALEARSSQLSTEITAAIVAATVYCVELFIFSLQQGLIQFIIPNCCPLL
jgi:hypothetical protein